MFGLLGGTRMFLPEKIVSTIKKPEAAKVVAVDIKEGKMSAVKNLEPEVLTVYIKDLRAISMLISGTMKLLSEMTGRIIKKMEAEVVGVDIKDLKAVLHLFVGTMKFLSEKIGSIIKMSEAKVVAAATDVKELIDIFMSLGGTMKFLLETVGSMMIKNPAACVDIKNLKAMCELFVGTMKFFLEKMGRGITKPTAAVVGLEIKDLNRDGVTYNAKVAVSNPYIVPMPIGQISYTLKSDDRMIVSGKMGKVGLMAAKEKTVLEVPVRVAHAILLSLMKDISKDGDIDYQLDLVVTILTLPLFGDVSIPLSWKGEIKLPSLFSIF